MATGVSEAEVMASPGLALSGVDLGKVIGLVAKAAVPELLVMRRTGSLDRRIRAAEALGCIDPEAAFPGLRDGLKDEDRLVRCG